MFGRAASTGERTAPPPPAPAATPATPLRVPLRDRADAPPAAAVGVGERDATGSAATLRTCAGAAGDDDAAAPPLAAAAAAAVAAAAGVGSRIA